MKSGKPSAFNSVAYGGHTLLALGILVKPVVWAIMQWIRCLACLMLHMHVVQGRYAMLSCLSSTAARQHKG